MKTINYHGDIKVNFINGAFCEISKGNSNNTYIVEFIDKKTSNSIYLTTIKSNSWASTDLKYFINYLVRIRFENSIIFEHDYDCRKEAVHIILDSKAIGDTLAWIPYVEEFRKNYNCLVICSTYHNEWF